MPIETERKFLVKDDGWKRLPLIKKINIKQGYLSSGKDTTLRVRITSTDGSPLSGDAFLTVKIEKPSGNKMSRYEFEQLIPMDEAKALMKMCDHSLEKTRYVLRDDKNQIWEVDIFKKALRGLKLAEIELPDEKHVVIPHPWLGKEVTEVRSYSNAGLALASVSGGNILLELLQNA